MFCSAYAPRTPSGCTRSAVALVVVGTLLAGCGASDIPERQLVTPHSKYLLDPASPTLKAHMHDGDVYVLSRWRVDESTSMVVGTGRLLDHNRVERESGSFEFDIESVALFETNVLQPSSAVGSMSVLTGLSLAMTAYCIANPKACFGSCPTFYARGPDGFLLQAEGFSSSVAPSLEASDVDALSRAAPTSRMLEIRMTNEALETHVVRYADVLALSRPVGGGVVAATDGRFYEVLQAIQPVSCLGPEGDCIKPVAALDGLERISRADPTYLGAKEEIVLEFAGVPNGDLGLVISSRQSLMTTYLFYQALSYLGSSACDWIAELERGDEEMRQRFNAMVDALGGIEVLAETTPGEFVFVGEIRESGPLATDTSVVRFPRGAGGNRRILLRMTKGLWRLDRVSLAVLGSAVEPLRLRPSEVLHNGALADVALDELTDPDRSLTTYPGDVYSLMYELPYEFGKYELFLETRGYYLEWMREEWLAEEDLARAVKMFLNTEQALRDLAPEFAAMEADMEKTFWSSRYVR